MKFSTITLTSLLSLALSAPTENPPYHYVVNPVEGTLDGREFIITTDVIVEQGGPFALTLNPWNWDRYTDILFNHTSLNPSSPEEPLKIECARAEELKFDITIRDRHFQFTGKDIVTPDSDNSNLCVLSVWRKAIDANYFGQQFIDNVLHGEFLPGRWIGPGPEPSGWKTN